MIVQHKLQQQNQASGRDVTSAAAQAFVQRCQGQQARQA